MDSCTSSASATVSYDSAQHMCGCAISAIEGRYALQEFSQIEVGLASGQIPQDILKIIEDCRMGPSVDTAV